MAVPKKRRSKSKGKIKLAVWKGKGRKMANWALSLAKSILNEESKFIFNKKGVEKNKEERNNSEY
uniref:Large ribosomal subunit protein bL32c n=1 Tax=Sargassum fusiforme TaxID=590727 RepID=A0A6B9TMN2_SARFS|nr:ribosomal protein L32 [Sargassum fusiforme]QHN51263.1 ribsomal protein L32 [Sargassum fusiforme]QJC13513.1 ribosomal protein L32 [Sargassum fusiforme]